MEAVATPPDWLRASVQCYTTSVCVCVSHTCSLSCSSASSSCTRSVSWAFLSFSWLASLHWASSSAIWGKIVIRRVSHGQKPPTNIVQYRNELYSNSLSCLSVLHEVFSYNTKCERLTFSFLRHSYFFISSSCSFLFSDATLILSWSLSSLQVASCFFHVSTLVLDSCSASTSRALLSFKVCSSVSHFLALVLLKDKSNNIMNIGQGLVTRHATSSD